MNAEAYTLTKGTQARRRKPNECARPLQAVRNFCVECMGYNANEVKRCTAPQCWLYPLRMGKNPVSGRKGNALNLKRAQNPSAVPSVESQGRDSGPKR